MMIQIMKYEKFTHDLTDLATSQDSKKTATHFHVHTNIMLLNTNTKYDKFFLIFGESAFGATQDY